MTRQPKARSKISSSTPDTVSVRGFDLAHDLMGNVNLGEMAFLELTGALPDEGTSIVFNAMLVSLVEHGVTPNTLAARLTYLGAPDALQGAVAAGLLGLGGVFVGSVEGAARILQEAIEENNGPENLATLAKRIVQDLHQRHEIIPGLGHPIHRPVDPRAVRLFDLARQYGLSGRYVSLMEEIAKEATLELGRPLPINVTGAIGAVASEIGLPWRICRGLGLMARSIGLVAHIMEEMEEPIAPGLWRQAELEAEG